MTYATSKCSAKINDNTYIYRKIVHIYIERERGNVAKC